MIFWSKSNLLKNNKFISAVASSALVLSSCGFLFFNNVKQSNAEESKPSPYVFASLTKVQDGTGWNKDGSPMKNVHTFITKENGFAIGDNRKDDGVVASRDVVEYNVNLNFSAAKARTINVKFNVGEQKLLKVIGNGSFCSSTNGLSARWHDANNYDLGCDYKIGAGETVSVTQNLFLQAADTNGSVKKSKPITMTVARDNGGSFTIRTSPITVVSSPAADLILDNGGNIVNKYAYERWDYLSQNSDFTGYFNFHVAPLKYNDWSDLGASTSNYWAGPDRPLKIDVSDFPSSTKFTLDGTKPLENNNGQIIITDKLAGDNHTLNYSIPKEVFNYSCTKNDDKGRYDCSDSFSKNLAPLKNNGGYAYFEAGIIPSKKVFATNTDSNALVLNTGKGFEPGSHKDKNYSSYNNTLGASEGYPFANNDWSRAVIRRNDPVYVPTCHPDKGKRQICFEYGKQVYRPYSAGHTIFDNESRFFDKTDPKTGKVGSNGNEVPIYNSAYNYNSTSNVAVGTKLRTSLMVSVNNDADKDWCNDNDCSLALSDSFDNKLQNFDGDLKVTFVHKGKEITLNPSEYTFQWTADNAFEERAADNNVALNDSLSWHNNYPSPDEMKTIRSIRVKVNRQPYSAGDTLKVSYVSREVKTIKEGSQQVYATMDVGLMGAKVEKRLASVYNVLKPGKPVASVTNGLKLVDPSVNRVKCDQTDNDSSNNLCMADAGDEAYYTVKPSYSNVAYTNSEMNPTVTVSISEKGLLNITNDVPEYYDMTPVLSKSGEISQLKFTLKNNADGSPHIAHINEDGEGSLPDIKWHATVGNKATGGESKTINTTALFAFDINKDKWSYKDIHSSNSVSSMNLNTSSISTGYIKAGRTVDVNNDMSWDFNLVVRGNNIDPSKDNQTVIRMPSNSDHLMGGADNSNSSNAQCTYNTSQGKKINTEKYPGIDCSWHEYDRGHSHFSGEWELKKEPVVAKDNSTGVSFKYAIGDSNDKNSMNPDDFTWKPWSELSSNDKKNIKAILIIAGFEKASNSKLAAAHGTITISPAGERNMYGNYNHSNDSYVAWIGKNNVPGDNATTTQTQPWADVNSVKAGAISGTLWWDDSNDGYRDDNEKTIPDAQIALYKASDVINGVVINNAKPVKIMNTWTEKAIKDNSWKNNGDYINSNKYNDSSSVKPRKGSYKFIELHEGDYVAIVKRHQGTGVTDGSPVSNNAVPTLIDKKEDYYNVERKVANTYSYDNKIGCVNNKQPYDSTCERAAKDYSSNIHVNFADETHNVDYGYYAPHPLVSLNKQITNTSCTGTQCKLQYAIRVKNNGNTVIHSGDSKIVDTISKDVKNVKMFMSSLSKGTAQVFTDGDHSLILSNGKLYSWGYNRNGQAGKVSDNGDQAVKPSTTALNLTGCSSADTGSMHSIAVCGGKVYTWGLNDSGQLGNGSADNSMSDNHTQVNNVPAVAKVPSNMGTPKLVAAGSERSYIVDVNGNLWSTSTDGGWSKIDSGVAVKAGSLSAFGQNASYITTDGSVKNYNFRTGSSNVVLNGDSFVQVAAGFNHVVALTLKGEVKTANVTNSNNNPGSFNQLNTPVLKNGGSKFISVTAGYMNSGAVDDKGNVYTWGLDLYGGLAHGNKNVFGKAFDNGSSSDSQAVTYSGDNALSNVKTAVKPNVYENANIIATGFNHALYATNTGEIKVAGLDAYSDGLNFNKTFKLNGNNVYKAGEINTQSIGSAKVYGSDYVDVNNMTSVNIDKSNAKIIPNKPLRSYTVNIPYDIPAGNELTFVVEGTVSRNEAIKKKDNKYQKGADKYIVNQAWFTSSETPFSQTPNARANDYVKANKAPALPSTNVDDWDNTVSKDSIITDYDKDSKTGGWDASSEKFTKVKVGQGNTSDNVTRTGSNDIHDRIKSCRAGYNFGEISEHTYGNPFNKYRADTDSAKDVADTADATANEDMCDQVGTVVAGLDKGAIFGTIKGIYWFDKNNNGIRDNDETNLSLPSKDNKNSKIIVSLWEVNNGKATNKISESSINRNGRKDYFFDKLPIDQNCEYDENGAVKSCSSKEYRVLFSPYGDSRFTQPDATNNGSSGTPMENDAFNDSDVVTDDESKDYRWSTFTIKWDNVNTSQIKEHVDAGIANDSNSKFSATGSKAILIAAIIIMFVIIITIIVKYKIK